MNTNTIQSISPLFYMVAAATAITNQNKAIETATDKLLTKKDKTIPQKHKIKSSLTEEDVSRIKDYFYNTPSRFKETNMRNYAYFCLSINYGKRCGDILNLRISDVINENGTPLTHIAIDSEQKTGKSSYTLFAPIPQQAVLEYLATLPSYNMDDYLFTNYRTGDKMTVQGMRKMLERMGKALNIPYNIGTHTLRRSWATHAYLNGTDIHLIQKNLNHTKMETTEIYLNESQAVLDNMMFNNQW